MPQVTVHHKFIHQAPRKLRLVGDMVRGLPAEKAVAEISTLTRGASQVIRQAILAAMAAARQQGLNMNALFIGQLTIDEGPKLRRMITLGRGRSQRIHKKMSHINLSLTDEPKKIASSKIFKSEGSK